MLSAETTVKASGFEKLAFSSELTLYWTKRDRVSEETQLPKRFRILIRSCDPPWLSTMSARSTCSGIEHRSSVQKKRAQSKKKWRSFLVRCAKDEGSLTFDVPRLSDTDLVSEQTASHTSQLVSLRNWSISRSWCSYCDLASFSSSS